MQRISHPVVMAVNCLKFIFMPTQPGPPLNRGPSEDGVVFKEVEITRRELVLTLGVIKL